MSKFKVGDRVRLMNDRQQLRAGAIGTVVEDHDCPFIEWDGLTDGHAGPYDDGRKTIWAIWEGDLELVDQEKPAPKFKNGDRVRFIGESALEPQLNGKLATALGYDWKGHLMLHFDNKLRDAGWTTRDCRVELVREPWELALESGEIYFNTGHRTNYVLRRIDGEWLCFTACHRNEKGTKWNEERFRKLFTGGAWKMIDAPPKPEDTIASLSAAYRQADEVHAAALERCNAARTAYADAEDELNSASDRLEYAGKALLEAIAKQ